MATLVDEHVLGFQVAVQDVVSVQKFDCEDHLREQELCICQLKALVLLQVVKQLTASAQVDHKAVVVRGDERVVQLDEKRVLQPLKDLAFGVDLGKFDLVLLDAIFLNQFHGVQLARGPLSDHVHCRETARPQHLHEIEVTKRGHLFGATLLLQLLPSHVVHLEDRVDGQVGGDHLIRLR